MTPRKSFSKLGNRATARLTTGLNASLMLPGRTVRCEIENVSRRGCRLRLDEPPRIGLTALVRVERAEALGTVAWVRGARCGIHFAKPLSVEAVERIRWMAEHVEDDQISKLKTEAAAWR
jgi:hypothetical protein